MYPSDYGYSGDSALCTSSFDSTISCGETKWLYDNSCSTYWTITPHASDSMAYGVFIEECGSIYGRGASDSRGIIPTVYLNENVKILDGDGTTDKPFVLSN